MKSNRKILYLLPNDPTPHEEMELNWLKDRQDIVHGFVYFNQNQRKAPGNHPVFDLKSFYPNNLRLYLHLIRFLFTNIKSLVHLNRSEFRAGMSYLKVSVRNGLALSNIVTKCEKCIVYSFWLFDPIPIQILKTLHPRTICVSRAHGGDIYLHSEYIGQNHIRIWRTEALKHFNLVLSVSEEGTNYLRQTHLLSNVRTLRLGSRTPSNIPVAQSEKRDYLTIVSVSNIIPLKRIPLIAKIISQSTRIVNWHHFGEARDATYMELVRFEINSILQHSNCTIIWHGKRDTAEILQFHLTEKPDFFISCSESEGIPVSIMEAMSCGIPVLATDAGGTHELINGNGILFDLNVTTVDASVVIQEWGQDPSVLERYRLRSYELWKENWSFETNQKVFIQIINQL